MEQYFWCYIFLSACISIDVRVGKMDSFTILIIILILIVVLVLIYYLLHFGHIDHLNARLDELTGQDATIPKNVREALHPLIFKVGHLTPCGYSHRYKIPPSHMKRVVLITCNHGFSAILDGERLADVLNETRYKQTLSGLLFPSNDESDLDVFTVDAVRPVLHFSERSVSAANASHHTPGQRTSSPSPAPVFMWQ